MSAPSQHPANNIDNYYVRQQARKLISDHGQMMRNKGSTAGTSLNLARGGHMYKSETDMTRIIDADMVASQTKRSRSWKQMDTYLKWQAIVVFMNETGVHTNRHEHFKGLFQAGEITGIAFDPKTQKITNIDFPGIKSI